MQIILDSIFIVIILITVFMILRIYLTLYWRRNFYRTRSMEKMEESVLLIVPCRGVDHNMEENFQSLRNQDHGNFQLVAVIDSPDDPASRVLSKLGVETIITEKYSHASSGKVMAITTAIRKKPSYDIIVIADSDIRVPGYWLREIVSPLKNPDIGVSSTYPRFLANGGFWARVKEIWGYMGISMMEFRPTRFVWGGSAAFRRELMDDKSLEYFSKAVSDDAAITRICKEKHLGIAYSSAASPEIEVSDSKQAFLDWAERQMAVSVVFDRKALFSAVAIYSGVILYLLVIGYLSLFYGTLFLTGYIPYLLNLVNSTIRAPRNIAWIVPISLLLPFIYIYNVIAGARSKEIKWRGHSYRIK